MLLLVYRQLTLNALRTALTTCALATIVAVILVLEGFYGGLLVQLRASVLNREADLIVTQAGVANMIGARSILPQFTRDQVESVDGVAAAHPLTGMSIIYEQNEVRTALFLLVYDSNGGPNRLAEGSRPSSSRDIVVDHSLKQKYGLAVGDPFVISDFEFRISGFSERSSAFFTPFGFAKYDDLIDFYFESDIAADISTFPLLSYLLVELAPGVDREDVAADIETHVPDGDVFVPQELAAEDESLGRVLFGPIMQLMVTVAYVIGALVTGIIMFVAVNHRRHEFGVLKALGFSNGFLSLSVAVEALFLAIVAIPLGVVLGSLIAMVMEVLAPLYLVLATEPEPVIRTAVACLLFALAGSLLPVGLIRRVDPNLAFRS